MTLSKLHLMLLIPLLLPACSHTPSTAPAPSMQTSKVTVQRADGSNVLGLIERPAKTEIPIIIYIDGSGCVSATRKRFMEVRTQPAWIQRQAATLVIEKTGVAPAAAWGSECSAEFSKYYSIDRRVLDHLLLIQYLRKHATWWNGEIYLIGWSDGGAIGSHVATYTPEVKRAILGGMGGGIPMWKQFEDYIICAEDRTDNRRQCIQDIRKNFDEIRNNPSPSKFWSGKDNSYKVWASRLDQLEYHLLKQLTIPILIMHGELDRDSVPVAAARELIRKLDEDKNVNFEYWEIPDMAHGLGNLEPERAREIRRAMLNWLFGEPPGAGGPPTFGMN